MPFLGDVLEAAETPILIEHKPEVVIPNRPNFDAQHLSLWQQLSKLLNFWHLSKNDIATELRYPSRQTVADIEKIASLPTNSFSEGILLSRKSGQNHRG